MGSCSRGSSAIPCLPGSSTQRGESGCCDSANVLSGTNDDSDRQHDRMSELCERLDSGAIKQLEPFGTARTTACIPRLARPHVTRVDPPPWLPPFFPPACGDGGTVLEGPATAGTAPLLEEDGRPFARLRVPPHAVATVFTARGFPGHTGPFWPGPHNSTGRIPLVSASTSVAHWLRERGRGKPSTGPGLPSVTGGRGVRAITVRNEPPI